MNEVFAILTFLLATFQITSAQDLVYKPNITNNSVLNKSCKLDSFGDKAVILAAGQSNMARFFTNERGNSSSTVITDLFESELKGKAGFLDVELLNAAYGGSSLSSDFFKDRGNYWVDTTNKSELKPGPRLKSTLEIIQRNKADLDLVLWNQGEADAALTPQYTNKQEYVANLRFVISEFRKASENPNLPIGIITTGRSRSSNDSHGFQEIRQAQYDVAMSDSNVHILASTYDLPLVDHIHYNEEGKKILVQNRLVPKIVSCLVVSGSDSVSGQNSWNSSNPPFVNSAKVNGTKVTLSVINDSTSLVAGRQSWRLFNILDSKGKRLANIRSVSTSGNDTIYLYLDRILTTSNARGAVVYTAYSGQKSYVPAYNNNPIIGIYNGNYPAGLPLVSNGVRLEISD